MLIQALGRQQQPLLARARDPVRLLPAMLLELALALQPRIAPLAPAADDLVRVELESDLLARLRLALIGRLGALFFRRQLLAGVAEELAPALRRAQLLG